MRSNKKAGMELSINTIIILILAIAILGVGLTFIKQYLTPAIKDVEAFKEQRRNEFIEELRLSGERFTWDMNFNEMKKGEEKTIFFGVKNELDKSMAFGLNIGCTGAIDEEAEPEKDITFTYFSLTDPTIKDAVAVDTVVIKVEPTAKSTIYRCKFIIGQEEDILPLDEIEDYYASKSFQIRVK